MRSRSKIYLIVAILVYLVVAVGVASTLYARYRSDSSAPVIEHISAVNDDHDHWGLKIVGRGLDEDTRLVVMPDTIDSPLLMSQSFDKSYMHDVEVYDDYLLVAMGRMGVGVIGRSDKSLLPMLSHTDLYGRVADVEVVGSSLYALLSNPARLAKLSLSTLPATPELTATVELSGSPFALHKTADAIFAVDPRRGLWAMSLDLKSVTPPESFPELCNCWGVASNSRDLFVISADGKFWSMPLKGPQKPLLVHDFSTKLRGVEADDRAVYVQTVDGHLYVFDCVEGRRPALIQEVVNLRRHSSGLKLIEGGGVLVDLSPSQGALLYQRDPEGRLAYAGNIMLSGIFSSADGADKVLYVSSSRGVSAWDLHSLPLTTERPFELLVKGGTGNIDIRGKYLLSLSRKGLSVLDLDRVDHQPRFSPEVGVGIAMARQRDHLWIARDGGAVGGFHLEPDGSITPCGNVTGTLGANRVYAAGGLLAVGVEKMLRVYAVSEPCQPHLLKEFPLEHRLSAIMISGDVVYATSQIDKEILSFRLGKTEDKRPAGRYRLPNPLAEFCQLSNLLKIEDTLYVSLGRAGLLALDVSDPKDLQQVFYVDTPSFSTALREHKGILYVADRAQGIWMLDLKGGRGDGVPRIIGSLNTVVDVQDLMFDRGRIFIAGSPKGVVMMDEPVVLAPEASRDDETFMPLSKDFKSGRYRVQAYNRSGHADKNLVVDIQNF